MADTPKRGLSACKLTQAETIAKLIEELSLVPYPSGGCGGMYIEVARSDLKVTSPEHSGLRNAFTTIHCMYKGEERSPWHKVASDETFFYHSGNVLQVHIIDIVNARYEVQYVGNPLDDPSARFILKVPRHCWFASRVMSSAGGTDVNRYCLLSAVVAPGWCPQDAAVLTRADTDVIKRLEELCPRETVDRYLNAPS